MFQTGRAALSLANDRRRYKLYQQILAVFEKYGTVRTSNIPDEEATQVDDRIEIMKCPHACKIHMSEHTLLKVC